MGQKSTCIYLQHAHVRELVDNTKTRALAEREAPTNQHGEMMPETMQIFEKWRRGSALLIG